MTQYEQLLETGRAAVEDYQAVIEKQIAKAYLDAYKEASKELATLYADLGADLTLPDAQTYNRLPKLLKEIEKAFKQATGKSINLTEGLETFIFQESWNHFWYAYETVYGSVAFGVLPVDAIRASVFSEVSGADFVKRFGKLYQGSIERIAEAITRGIATGIGYKKTASSIMDQWNNTVYQAVRVVRTESTRNYTEGSIAAYDRAREKGIDGSVVWISTFDGRTRDTHAQLNGQKANKEGLFYIGSDSAKGPGLFSEPQNSIQCRCSTRFQVAGPEELETIKDWKYSAWREQYGSTKKEV
jgi:SPP1 gp7 family putative phage head morphogenesis protein